MPARCMQAANMIAVVVLAFVPVIPIESETLCGNPWSSADDKENARRSSLTRNNGTPMDRISTSRSSGR
nr:hypothetical protein [Candidatus Microthrix sp.]